MDISVLSPLMSRLVFQASYYLIRLEEEEEEVGEEVY
jgi:hypothetical protein